MRLGVQFVICVEWWQVCQCVNQTNNIRLKLVGKCANVRMGVWQNGRVAEWASGRMGECASGRVAKWANVRVADSHSSFCWNIIVVFSHSVDIPWYTWIVCNCLLM